MYHHIVPKQIWLIVNLFSFCFLSFSLDGDDFERAVWDPKGTKSHSHVQQRRKPLCNRGIDPMSKGLWSDDSVKTVELLGEIVTEIQETLFQNIYKAKLLLFLFLNFFFFLMCTNNALKE